MPATLVLEGVGELIETDAGFLPCEFVLNEHSVAMAVAVHLGLAQRERERAWGLSLPNHSGMVTLGPMRVTVEWLTHGHD